jgi:amidase
MRHLKPTWGRVSRFGVFELAASLDHVGPIARSAADVAVILNVIAGPAERDSTALTKPVPDYLKTAGNDLQGMRIGIDAQWNSNGVDDSVRAVLADTAEVFERLGAQLVEVSVPYMRQAVADWAPACAVEAAVAHENTFPSRRDEYGSVLASVLDAGIALSGLDLQKILLRRMELRGRFTRLMRTIDLLLLPVQPYAPVSLAVVRTLGEQPQLILDLQRYTAPLDLMGNPTITLPGGLTDSGIPIGFQLAGRHLDEATLLRAGIAFQSATTWHTRHPVE